MTADSVPSIGYNVFAALRSGLHRLRRSHTTAGLELGASACRCVSAGTRTILEEKAVMVRREGTEDARVVAVGDRVHQIICSPAETALVQSAPFARQQTIRHDALVAFFTHFRQETAHKTGGIPPADLTVTGRPRLLRRLEPLLEDAAGEAGFSRSRTLPQVACLRAGLGGSGAAASMLVDIGDVSTRLYPMPGSSRRSEPVYAPGVGHVRRRLQDHMRTRFGLAVGNRTAAELLAADGTVGLTVKGRDLTTNRPRAAELSREDLTAVVAQFCNHLSTEIKRVAEQDSESPRTVVIVGGGASLPQLKDFLAAGTGLPVDIPQKSARTSVLGLQNCLVRRKSAPRNKAVAVAVSASLVVAFSLFFLWWPGERHVETDEVAPAGRQQSLASDEVMTPVRERVAERVATRRSRLSNRLGHFEMEMNSHRLPGRDVQVHVRVRREGRSIWQADLDGCSLVGPDEIKVVPLTDGVQPWGWMIGTGGICGNTFSWRYTLVIPFLADDGWKCIRRQFLSKKPPVLRPQEPGMLEIWSCYQESGREGTAYSFFVPERRLLQAALAQDAAPRCLNVSPGPRPNGWPVEIRRYITPAGMLVAGASCLDPALMQRAVDRVLTSETYREVFQKHNLPTSRQELNRIVEDIRAVRRATARFEAIDLLWHASSGRK